MAQADYVISPNPTGLAMRTEVNQIFQAILTNNAGSVAPTTTQAGMFWGDISNASIYYLKIRNHTNDGWVSLYAYDVATKTIQAMVNDSTLTSLLALKANLASPTFTGTVVLPSTTSIGTVSNTEIGYLDGVTSAIQTQLNTKADLASPALTGTPTAPTASLGTNTTQLATTAFVLANATIPDATETVAGKVELATNAEVQAGTDTTRAVTPAGMKAGLNASGTAPIYTCRAWVNFNGTGTVAIRASGNVSSITDQGTGGYTINFTTAMPDANYSSVVSISPTVFGNNNGGMVNIASTISGNNQNELAPTTSAVGVTINDRGGTAVDIKYVSAAIFR